MYSKTNRDISYDDAPSFNVELILGLLGGIIGCIAGIVAIMVGSLGSAIGINGYSQIIGMGLGAIIFSVIGIIGAAIVKSKTKLSGYLMIISAIGGLICVSLFYVLSFILLIIAGILAAKKAPNSQMGPALGSQSKLKSGSILVTIGKAFLVLFVFLIIASSCFQHLSSGWQGRLHQHLLFRQVVKPTRH